MIPASVYAAKARAAKAAKLVDALDYAFDLAKVTLHEARYVAVAGIDDAAWKSASVVAGVNLPSLETREIVLNTFRRRVQASVDAQIAASLRKAVG
jgi:hypothetical protein